MDQGDFTILACLKENRPKLSAACRYSRLFRQAFGQSPSS
jgi:hypothetical protein